MNTYYDDIYLTLSLCMMPGKDILTIIDELKKADINPSNYKDIARDFLKANQREAFFRIYERLDDEKEKLYKSGIHVVNYDSYDYPAKLINIPDPPAVLYIKGNYDPKQISTACISIVGARSCSEYGSNMSYNLARELSLGGITIISGMARGIDSEAHKGALSADGTTIAILGCGADICYPRENISIYNSILKKGAIISELPPNTPPISRNFPLRNRIISGLCDALIIVEARDKSGSLITVDQALEQGKDIYAVPGRIGDPLSYGCNRLIKMGAGMITGIGDFVEEILGDVYKANSPLTDLTNHERLVYDHIDSYPTALEDIYKNTSSDMEFIDVLQTLWDLQDKRLVKECSQNYYVRVI
ncbi:MAG: DNA-processing protein DprA [Lachnospiraceae bacterium]|nr:DNA-processing protein DprA [Lachnospiraceae bacterium]